MLGQLLDGVVEVDTGHQFGARIGVDGATNLLAHLPCGSDNSHTDCLQVSLIATVGGEIQYSPRHGRGDRRARNIMLLLHVLTGFVAFAPAIAIPSCRPRYAPGGTERPVVLGTSPRTRCGSMAVP